MISKYTYTTTGSYRRPRHELSKGGLVLSEKIVDDDPPISDAFRSHLKEIRFKEQLEHFFTPRLSRVLVTAERGDQRTAGAKTWNISKTERK